MEWIGYISTVLVLSSFLASDIRLLRVLNSAGGLGWICYGLTIGSNSVIIANIAIVCINMYKLHKENNNDEETNKRSKARKGS